MYIISIAYAITITLRSITFIIRCAASLRNPASLRVGWLSEELSRGFSDGRRVSLIELNERAQLGRWGRSLVRLPVDRWDCWGEVLSWRQALSYPSFLPTWGFSRVWAYSAEESKGSSTCHSAFVFDWPAHKRCRFLALMPPRLATSSALECWSASRSQRQAGSCLPEQPMQIFPMGFQPFPQLLTRSLCSQGSQLSSSSFCPVLSWPFHRLLAITCPALLTWTRCPSTKDIKFQRPSWWRWKQGTSVLPVSWLSAKVDRVFWGRLFRRWQGRTSSDFWLCRKADCLFTKRLIGLRIFHGWWIRFQGQERRSVRCSFHKVRFCPCRGPLVVYQHRVRAQLAQALSLPWGRTSTQNPL